jgi:hypothetical protein
MLPKNYLERDNQTNGSVNLHALIELPGCDHRDHFIVSAFTEYPTPRLRPLAFVVKNHRHLPSQFQFIPKQRISTWTYYQVSKLSG